MVKTYRIITLIIGSIILTILLFSLYYRGKDETLAKNLLTTCNILNIVNFYFIYKYHSLKTLQNDKNH